MLIFLKYFDSERNGDVTSMYECACNMSNYLQLLLGGEAVKQRLEFGWEMVPTSRIVQEPGN